MCIYLTAICLGVLVAEVMEAVRIARIKQAQSKPTAGMPEPTSKPKYRGFQNG